MPKANMNRILTVEEQKQIVRLYKNGLRPSEICKKLRTYHKYVIKVLNDNGLHFYVNELTNELKEKIINDYVNAQETITSISDKYLIKRDKIRNFLNKSGVYKGDDRGLFTNEDLEWLRIHYPSDDWSIILSHFPSKNRQSIHSFVSKYGIKRDVDIWTEEEINKMKMVWEDRPPREELLRIFPNRSLSAIYSKAEKLGITKTRLWTEEEDAIIREKYKSLSNEEIDNLFPNRSGYSVQQRARKLGIYSDTYNMPWTSEEDVFLIENWMLLPDYRLGECIGRSRQGVKERRHYLKLYRQDMENKTYPTLSKYLRGQIWDWKSKSMEACQWKCVLTGSKDFEIHHLYGVSNILSDIISKYNIQEKQIEDYSQEELNYITNLFIREQNKYPLGVCIRKDIHVLFHKLYGQYYNTPEQWYQFESDYKNGAYDKLINNKIA